MGSGYISDGLYYQHRLIAYERFREWTGRLNKSSTRLWHLCTPFIRSSAQPQSRGEVSTQLQTASADTGSDRKGPPSPSTADVQEAYEDQLHDGSVRQRLQHRHQILQCLEKLVLTQRRARCQGAS
jgi:hypothetical protein